MKKILIVLAAMITLAITVSQAQAWVEPNQIPPEGNIAAPLNTGSFAQSKIGGLILNLGNATHGLIVKYGLVGIGTDNPQAKLDVAGKIRCTGLEVTSATEGVVFPRMTTAQRNAIASPQLGMIIINTDTRKMNMYNGSSWDDGLTPSGTVAHFDLNACPEGWTEVTDARGRYLVGTPAGGNVGNSSLTGEALTNKENRSVGLHTHGVYDPGHTHGFPGMGCNGYTPWNCNSYAIDANNIGSLPHSLDTRPTGIDIYNAGSVAGTNAPYIQFLVCRKN